ncbi:DUF6338 family protein [Aurantimonas sp. Leaf443]|uniref:DUF6338 family protein n=1 Tax=Aurantimonas sp. Leaf443 TaxID=1736378 RepID=UPI0006FE70A5|nr:DUF6338 family protein [Aurantimonas sp. Leaf443]KQT88380.1 hypothetical protein ASG48_02870 [Aurantimonas sp. Leaf443]
MGDINAFVVMIGVIFLPGILWARFDARYARQTKPSDFALVLNAFMFGIASYVLTALLYEAWNLVTRSNVSFDLLVTFEEGAEKFQGRIIDEIAVASCVAVVGGVLWLYGEQYKLVTRALQAIGATRRYGDEDVWDFTFTSTSSALRYVHVRDFSQNAVFAGWVESFSETGMMRELVLSGVQVYNSDTGEFIYATPRVYLARQPDGMTIEFPAQPEQIRQSPDDRS